MHECKHGRLARKCELCSLEAEVKELRHYKDSTIGLWVTDKEPEDKTGFWQLKESEVDRKARAWDNTVKFVNEPDEESGV